LINDLYQHLKLWNRRRRYLKKDALELDVIQRFVTRGSIFFDIGAHKGVYTSFARDQIGPEGIIVCFEPQSVLNQYLERLVELKHWNNVKVEKLALSNVDGETDFFIPDSKSGTSPSASLENGVSGFNGRLVNVRTQSLDSYCNKEGLWPDFIKCDVEGHELTMLSGAKGLFETKAPSVLIECEQRHIKNGSVQEVISFFISKDYKGFFFSDEGLLSVNKFDPSVHQKMDGERFWELRGYVNNFFFTK